jgi:hypothetical protein
MAPTSTDITLPAGSALPASGLRGQDRRPGRSPYLAAALTAALLAACAPQPAVQPDPAGTPEGPASVQPDDTEMPSDSLLDLSFEQALHDFFGELAEAGGGQFSEGFFETYVEAVLIPAFEATGGREYGEYGEWPVGVDLSSQISTGRARWSAAGATVVAAIEAQLQAWPNIEMALDTSKYGYAQLDEISRLAGEYFRIDVEYYEAMLALTRLQGPEALVTEDAIAITVAWLNDPRRNSVAEELLSAVVSAPITVDGSLADRFNAAVPGIQMGVSNEPEPQP